MMMCLILAMILWGHPVQHVNGCIQGDCMNGSGTKVWSNDNRYTGSFSMGMMHGEGEMYYADGGKYLGSWNKGQKYGEGKYVFPDGSIYMGHFQGDVIEGQGQMRFSNGDRYEGNWHKGKPEGVGVYEFFNGDSYTGEFVLGLFDGNGRYNSQQDGIIEGVWKQQKLIKHWMIDSSMILLARDTLKSSEQKVKAIGTVTQNNPNNKKEVSDEEWGEYIYKNGAKYMGDFKKGIPDGLGTCQYVSGNKYTGEWYNNAPHGKGVMLYTSGEVYGGIWEHGKSISPLDMEETYKIARNEMIDRDEQIKTWAVVIGVSKYDFMPALNYSDDDAYRFYAFLKSPEGGSIPDKQIHILIDGDAKREHILTTLKNTFYKADCNDRIILYYSGHGLGGTLLPIDYDGQKNQIYFDEIEQILLKSQAEFKVCYMDACYSGGAISKKPNSARTSLTQESEDSLRKYRGMALLLSSKAEEYSLEDGGLRQGVFSHFLMRGLKGEANVNGDQVVSIQELYKYVNFQVRKYTGSVQNPVIMGDYNNSMPVAVQGR